MSKKLLFKKNQQIIQDLTREIPENGIISIGSDTSATVFLDDTAIAPEQFIIICEDGKLMILNRSAGTSINRQMLAPGALQQLIEGDEISLGEFSCAFKDSGATDAELLIAELAHENLIQSADQAEAEDSAENPAVHITMNDVLENLRSDEKFYFHLENPLGTRRIYVEFEEMWLGWTADGASFVTENPAEIKTACAQIRKDWSGVVLYSNQPQTVLVNGEILSNARRLKNDDLLQMQLPNESRFDEQILIRFHEPTALLVLDSLLPKELPPPVSFDLTQKNREHTAVQNIRQKSPGKSSSNLSAADQTAFSPAAQNRIFGYFNLGEILIMTVGTLLTAAIIFIFLEWF